METLLEKVSTKPDFNDSKKKNKLGRSKKERLYQPMNNDISNQILDEFILKQN